MTGPIPDPMIKFNHARWHVFKKVELSLFSDPLIQLEILDAIRGFYNTMSPTWVPLQMFVEFQRQCMRTAHFKDFTIGRNTCVWFDAYTKKALAKFVWSDNDPSNTVSILVPVAD